MKKPCVIIPSENIYSIHSGKRTNLQLSADYPAFVLFDNFNGQCTESLLKLLDVNNINIVIFPANWIDQLQPMDVSVNKFAKEYLRKRFQQWYAEGIMSQSTSKQAWCQLYIRISRLTVVSREAKKKCSNATTVGSYLHAAPPSNSQML